MSVIAVSMLVVCVFFFSSRRRSSSTIDFRPLPSRKLTQQVAHKLRILISLLLYLTLSHGVEGPEKPHFLQVADEHLQVLGGFDLLGWVNDRR